MGLKPRAVPSDVVYADPIGERFRFESRTLPRELENLRAVRAGRRRHGPSAAGRVVVTDGSYEKPQIIDLQRRLGVPPWGPGADQKWNFVEFHPRQERALIIGGLFNDSRMYEVNLDSAETRMVVDTPNARAAYLGDDHLVTLADGVVTLCRFAMGDEAPVALDSVAVPNNGGLNVLDRGLVITGRKSSGAPMLTRLLAAHEGRLELIGELRLAGPSSSASFVTSWRDYGERLLLRVGKSTYQLRPTSHPILADLRAKPAGAEVALKRDPPPPEPFHDYSYLRIARLSTGGRRGKTWRRPSRQTVAAELAAFASGRHENVWLSLEKSGPDRAPSIWVAPADAPDQYYVSFVSERFELATPAHPLPRVERIFELFFREQRLDEADGWLPI